MTQPSRAWVMDVGDGGRVAAGARHVVEYLLAPETVPVPCMPAHCAGLLYWRERYIPVIDFAPLLGARADNLRRRAVILAYQNAPGERLQYGALLASTAPVEAWVSDDMATALPSAPPALRYVARACFRLDDQVVPILDTRRLFAEPLPLELLPAQEMREEAVIRILDDRLVCAVPESEPPAPVPADGHGMPIWAALETVGVEPADTAPIPVSVGHTGPPPQEFNNPPYCVVIPFATRATQSATEPVDAAAEHSVLMGYSSVPGNNPAKSWPTSVATGANSIAGHGDSLAAHSLVDSRSSAVLRSFHQLRELESRHALPVRRRGRWLSGALAALVLLALAWVVLNNSPRSLSAPAPAARDVRPAEAGPASVPAAPAQPPE